VPCTHRCTQNAPTEASSSAHAMSEHRNTLACCFDPTSPQLTAFDIHEWIHSQLQVSERSVLVIQIDGTCSQVFIKNTDLHFVRILNAPNGETVYKHTTGEISPVQLMIAGMGTRRFRLANLSPELPNTTIRTFLSQYGDLQSIQDETWAKHYRYTVSNVVRVVMMTLKNIFPHTSPSRGTGHSLRTMASRRHVMPLATRNICIMSAQNAGRVDHGTCPS